MHNTTCVNAVYIPISDERSFVASQRDIKQVCSGFLSIVPAKSWSSVTYLLEEGDLQSLPGLLLCILISELISAQLLY